MIISVKLLESVSTILYVDGVDAGVDAVGQGEIDDAVLAPEGDGGLCHVAGEGVETAALSSGQQHGYNFFFHTVTSYEYWVDIMQRRR